MLSFLQHIYRPFIEWNREQAGSSDSPQSSGLLIQSTNSRLSLPTLVLELQAQATSRTAVERELLPRDRFAARSCDAGFHPHSRTSPAAARPFANVELIATS